MLMPEIWVSEATWKTNGLMRFGQKSETISYNCEETFSQNVGTRVMIRSVKKWLFSYLRSIQIYFDDLLALR